MAKLHINNTEISEKAVSIASTLMNGGICLPEKSAYIKHGIPVNIF
jgi:hypothetical protein